jgi:hypothetical protein
MFEKIQVITDVAPPVIKFFIIPACLARKRMDREAVAARP